MVSILISSLWVLVSMSQISGASTADETCMLQSSVGQGSSRTERTNVLVQQTSLTAAEQKELAELEQSPSLADSFKELNPRARVHKTERAPMMLLETASSVESEIEVNHETFQKPQIWGPAAWFFLHSIALAQGQTIPEDKQERLRRFFTEDLAFLLPCPACAQTVQDHVSAMEIDDDTFADRDSVFGFVFDLHNMVNADKGVPEIDFDEAVLNYAQAFDQGITDLHFEGFDQASRDLMATNQDSAKSESATTFAPNDERRYQ